MLLKSANFFLTILTINYFYSDTNASLGLVIKVYVMKKVLEVLQYGENEIRFNTDFDVRKDPRVVLDVTTKALMAMVTTLWGGNETSVIAMIRALSIADLAASVNVEEMVEMLKESAYSMKRSMTEAEREMTRSGVNLTKYCPAPGFRKMKS